ncbi:MAG TPA: SDR family NAD(P)-dependent oxidoreductase [Thermoguttaceae bacterium]|nr:SDR family NAD(P)-dependent oxidoreductase [Thermoguttaceae bacterium]
MMFEGKNVLVTGSARNTGLGIARVFGGYGATVFVHGRSAEQVEKIAQTLNRDGSGDGGRYLPIAADVAREDDVALAFSFIDQQVGGLDVLVNNACHLGLGHRFLDMPIAFFDEVLAVNLRGYALCAQYAARQMVARGGGAIVNIGSNTAGRALGDRAAYIASKGGVESLTRAIAVELAEHHIRVNCIVPGYIYTERWDTLPEETKERRWKNVPLGKESSPEDIGEAAAFLACSKAGNITGSSLLVSGGIDIQLLPPDCAV